MALKNLLAGFHDNLSISVYGAGFRKEGVDISGDPRLITLDGHSVYFSGIGEKEASGLLEGVTLLNGRTGWLSYILQELFFDERVAQRLYEEIFDSLYTGLIKGPEDLSRESVLSWAESVAPEVEKIVERLLRSEP